MKEAIKLSKKSITLKKLIKRNIELMDKTEEGTEDYEKLRANLEELYRLQKMDKEGKTSREEILKVAGSLGGILLIIAFEERHVLTTKAMGLIRKIV